MVAMLVVAAAAVAEGGGRLWGGEPRLSLHEVQILFAAFNETDGQRPPSTYNEADSGAMACGPGIVSHRLVMACVNK